MFLLIVMLDAGGLSLRLVDSCEGHESPLFVAAPDRVEEWFALHDRMFCANGIRAIREALDKLNNKPVGYEIVVVYEPAPSSSYRGAGAVLQGSS